MRIYLSVAAAQVRRLDDRALDVDALVPDAACDPAEIGALRSRVPNTEIYLRVGDVNGPGIADDLAAAMPIAPTGLVLTATHGRDVTHLGARLAVHEALCGLPDGTTRIVASIAGAGGVIDASRFRDASPRLSGLTWDPNALARELGLERAADAHGWVSALALVRGTVRLTAAAARVEAIEAACPPGDAASLRRHLAEARRDGFGGIVLADPAQVALVRRAGSELVTVDQVADASG